MKTPSIYPKMKILIVDDMPTIRQRMKSLLFEIGFMNIDEVDSGEEALTLIQQENACEYPYDLIITDIKMHGMDGITLLKKIKTNPMIKHTRVFMVSTVGDASTVLKAVEIGASDYLLKPFYYENLREKIFRIFYREKCA